MSRLERWSRWMDRHHVAVLVGTAAIATVAGNLLAGWGVSL